MFNKVEVIENYEFFNQKSDYEKIKAGVDLLVTSGFATTVLFDKIKEAIEQFGPYFVFDNGIAVAHSPQGEHCKKLGTSLITSKQPFNLFGKKINLLITLSVPLGEDHMKLLQKIVILVGDENEKNRFINFSKENER